MKILIAEDDPISRRILEANLLEWGYKVMVASDGAEAWGIIQQPEPPNRRSGASTVCGSISHFRKAL